MAFSPQNLKTILKKQRSQYEVRINKEGEGDREVSREDGVAHTYVGIVLGGWVQIASLKIATGKPVMGKGKGMRLKVIRRVGRCANPVSGGTVDCSIQCPSPLLQWERSPFSSSLLFLL